MKAWDRIIEKESKDNPFFAKVIKSQKEFAARSAAWRKKFMVEMDIAYDYWFKKKA
jgi:TRAP-type mannitol/chloroaromatic compound transport system substrate-binding protein